MKLGFRMLVYYHIDFRNKQIVPASVLAGASFFFLCVHYFGLTNLTQCGFGEVLLQMILPMLVMVGFVVLLRVIRFSVTPLYGALGTLFCILMLIRAFTYGNFFAVIIAVLWYILAGAVYLLTAGGYFSSNLYILIAVFAPVGYRLVFVDIYQYLIKRDFSQVFTEAAALCGLAAFGLFGLCLKAVPIKNQRRVRAK